MFDRIKFFFINNKKIIIIAFAVLLVIFIVIFSIPGKKAEPVVTPVQLPGQEIISAPTIQKTVLTDEDKAKSSISVVGKNFAEIYGSYSNQSNYSNIESVLPLLSSRYKTEMAQVLESSRSTYRPGITYEGVTAVRMNEIFESFDASSGIAVLIVKTQRKVSNGTQANYTLETKDIRLIIVKEGENWLVDSAKWL